jgi:transaldolase
VLEEIVDALGPERDAQVLAASLRNPLHVVTAARLGCEVATVPGKLLRQMLVHPLTEAGIEKFAADWQSRPELAEWLEALVLRREPAAR